MKEVKPGDVLRLRYMTHSEPDGVGQKGFRPPDGGRLKSEKKVFVVLVLGTEPLLINDDANTDQGLDPDEALRNLGWHPDQDDDDDDR
jgi:hypothetical protein